MDIAYPNIAERLFGRPHAIDPFALRAILDGPLARRILSGERMDAKKSKQRRDIRRDRLSTIANAEQVRSADGIVEYGRTNDGVAIIPIAGVLSRRFDWLAAACGWSTYEGLSATLEAALADARVRAVLLDVDSPGGEADGMLDVADAIIAARAKRTVWAVANALAASAAYAVAGSAERLYLPRLAQVGSIGCVTIHVDQSKQDAAIGLAYTAIYSGARKVDGWGHAPLSEAARAAAQAGVDHVRDEFAALVGRQGRMTAAAALATEAAAFADQAAIDAGLADQVGTFAEVLAALTREVSPTFQGAKTMTTAKPATTKPDEKLAASASPAAVSASAAAPSATAAVAAAAEPSAETKKGADDMTPPKPGEKCALCGQTMPDDDEKAKAAAATAAAAAALAPAQATAVPYGQAEIAQTLELCAIAGVAATTAQAFITAKTPLVKVRADLVAARAEAADKAGIIPHVTVGDGDGTSSSQAIVANKRKIQEGLRAELGIGKRN